MRIFTLMVASVVDCLGTQCLTLWTKPPSIWKVLTSLLSITSLDRASFGNDGILPRFLKACSKEFALELALCLKDCTIKGGQKGPSSSFRCMRPCRNPSSQSAGTSSYGRYWSIGRRISSGALAEHNDGAKSDARGCCEERVRGIAASRPR